VAKITLVQVRFQDDERSALDNYRRRQENLPSRAEAARQLVRRALFESSDASAAAATS
jgi:hypothetical protein